jgi:hypothetical protein
MPALQVHREILFVISCALPQALLALPSNSNGHMVQDVFVTITHASQSLSPPFSHRGLDPEIWLTSIWRDLLEGDSTLTDMSEEEFDEQFFALAQSEKSISGQTWGLNTLRAEYRTVALPQLNKPMSTLFGPQGLFSPPGHLGSTA